MGKTRHGMQQDGETERGEKKNERRKGTKEGRKKMSGKMQKSTKKPNQQSF